MLPGPTLRVRRNDTLRLRLVNELEDDPRAQTSFDMRDYFCQNDTVASRAPHTVHCHAVCTFPSVHTADDRAP